MEKALNQLARLSVSKISRNYGQTFELNFGEISFAGTEEMSLSVYGNWRLVQGEIVLADSKHSDWIGVNRALKELIGTTCHRPSRENKGMFAFEPGGYELQVTPDKDILETEFIWSINKGSSLHSVGLNGRGEIIEYWPKGFYDMRD